MDNFINILFAIFSFGIILVLAYFTTKMVAMKSTNMNNGKNMEIIDVLNLGNHKKILLVKILGKIYVIGTSNNSGFNKIDEIQDEDIINNLSNSNYHKSDFDNLLKSKLSFINKNQDPNEELPYNNLNKLDKLKDKLKELKLSNSSDITKDE
ncbi:flagellar biosynthetic protein FliO [Senegalia massiliensis]|uniref:flagellar biosynthetic protein FliO n=1 Tax=Senegalia massiliensis TaxID=1720316 RepID=UPI0010314C01|nr:flagellar biosynthetic protein FliO [Senegalia massiliensis]